MEKGRNTIAPSGNHGKKKDGYWADIHLLAAEKNTLYASNMVRASNFPNPNT